MGRGRPKAALVLAKEERATLARYARRRKSSQGLALRARIVLRCASGLDNTVVAGELGITDDTVAKWRGRFVRERLNGLVDEPRSGAPRKIGDDAVEAIVVKTLETTPPGQTHWSTRGMAKRVGISRTSVSRIWRAFGLQPPGPARLPTGRFVHTLSVCSYVVRSS